jgi:hypothetical protein
MNYPGRRLIVNKANKIGMTEAILRDMIRRAVVGDCRGYLLMLGAQDYKMAKENMNRLQAIFERSNLLRPLIRHRTVTALSLQDGTRFLTMPRRAASIRGWARLKYVFLDEASHYGLLDDEEFLSATTSRLSNTDGYLRIVSTPNGQRGFFYRLYTAAVSGEAKEWKQMTFPYQVGIPSMFTEAFIEGERTTLGNLFDQEYNCDFVGAGNVAFESELVDSIVEDYESS